MKLNYLSFISASQIFSYIVFKDVALTILRYNKFQISIGVNRIEVYRTFSIQYFQYSDSIFFALAII